MNQWAKERAWSGRPPRLVALSHWLAERAKSSTIFRDADIRVIPPSVDVDVFRPHPQILAREILGIPSYAKVIAFVAQNASLESRKGLNLLMTALNFVRHDRPRHHILLLTAGARSAHEDMVECKIAAKHLGMVEDDRTLSLAYAASDVIAVPSTEEAFGKVAIEGMSCGRPVVAFDRTGVADAIDDGVTGLLAGRISASDFAAKIGLLLDHEELARRMGFDGRRQAELQFCPATQARQYISLYEEMLTDAQ